MIMVTTSELAQCSARSDVINHARTESLQLLGNYTRKLPVSIERMMENAHDWEHLPVIHASTFSGIKRISQGRWGWRAKVQQTADDGADQVIELLVDRAQNYWATTVVTGPGAGVEIHTQATALSAAEIEIDVRFYSSTEVPGDAVGMYLEVLRQQYALLYDEDLGLMSGRQKALDNRARWKEVDRETGEVLVGDTEALAQENRTIVATASGRYCVRQFNNEWVVHSAVCSHQLGPLDDASLAPDGTVQCPWHGYRFSVATGENLDGKCRALEAPPLLREEQGKLYLVFGD